MPNVDFTLEDIAQQTQRIIGQALIQERVHAKDLVTRSIEAERSHTKELIQQSLKAALNTEREHTRAMLAEARAAIDQSIEQKVARGNESMKQFIVGEFLGFWDHDLEPAFEDLHNEFAETKERFGRLIDQHSKDIMELRAHRT